MLGAAKLYFNFRCLGESAPNDRCPISCAWPYTYPSTPLDERNFYSTTCVYNLRSLKVTQGNRLERQSHDERDDHFAGRVGSDHEPQDSDWYADLLHVGDQICNDCQEGEEHSSRLAASPGRSAASL